jgi:adenine-specific DNA-methyltransferase
VTDIWQDFRDPFNQNFAITGYPTEKNLDLLRRLVSAASNPGDLILDCYAGSGTTLDAAGGLERRWIGIDSGDLAIALAQRRLAERALSEDRGADGARDFELWSDAPDPPPATAFSLEDTEFAFVESVDGTSAHEILQILKPGEVSRRLECLRAGERLVAFDHGGGERLYTECDSIQLNEKRPA